MLFEYRYFGTTEFTSTPHASGLSFAPDTRRAPTFLSGRLRRKLPFREAMSALHQVVVNDLRFRPKDRTEYFAWRAQQDDLELSMLGQAQAETAARLDEVRAELGVLRQRQAEREGPFRRAQRQFFDWLYKKNVDAWFVLDPVICVHPDTVSFECFSLDESSYGRLSCSHDVFEQLGEVAYGTTNVDYSEVLFEELQKIREDKETHLAVDPAGFEVQTGADEAYREVKIDLPDSWVRGFLQVSTAMGLPGGARLQLHPMDLHNLCFVLRRHKETHGPRSLRFLLIPGRPVEVEVEPFGIALTFARSTHDAREPAAIRVWGRRRLLVLERLIPVARSIEVTLLGSGMPSFWVARCGDLTFTLGLSGWTANDWASGGQFDLLGPRGDVDEGTAARVLDRLRASWSATPEALSAELGLDRATVDEALVGFAQAGRAMYDLAGGVWRLRELTRDPLDLGKLRFASEREAEASALVRSGDLRVQYRALEDGRVRLEARVHDRPQASAVVDADRRIVEGACDCRFFFQNKLRRGPCAHLLAARLAWERRLATIEAAPPPPPLPPAAPPQTGSPFLDLLDRLRLRPVDLPAEPAPQPPVRSTARVRRGADDLGPEAERLVQWMVERGSVELAAEHRPAFVAEVARILLRDPTAGRRAKALWALLLEHPAVEEFYLLSEEDVLVLVEEWG